MAAVFGCAGPELSQDEAAFFRDSNPLGFILFARNSQTADQIRRLTDDLRQAVGRDDAPILMDHEGGRVQRLPSPPWRKVPPAAAFGAMPIERAVTAVALNAQLMAMELLDLGIDVNCVPCLDVTDLGGHQAIGDRAFSADPNIVVRLGRAQADGLVKGGVLPVMKHMPGHGRAGVDSHHELPVVTADHAALAERDFQPFKALSDLPLGMTGHILFADFDPDHPATHSQTIISEIIRGQIGFNGLLFTDDLSMQALGGNIAQRGARALTAGCDIALHCNGNAGEMQSLVNNCPPMSDQAQDRWQRALVWRSKMEDGDYEDICAQLDQLM